LIEQFDARSERMAVPGLRFRMPTPGPESDMVSAFLASLKLLVPRGHHVTVLREPHLPSGVPDVVVVVWRPSVTSKWSASRLSLTATDYRLVHLLSTTGAQTTLSLTEVYSSCILDSVERLASAGMVVERNGMLRAVSPRQTCATRYVVALEAKTRVRRALVEQASAHRWFANESYAVVPTGQNRPAWSVTARRLGVEFLPSDTQRLDLSGVGLRTRPLSYATWQLGDWAWRLSSS